MLMNNEHMTLFTILKSYFNLRNIMESILIFVALFLTCFKGVNLSQEKSYLVTGGIMGAYFLVVFLMKLYQEEFF